MPDDNNVLTAAQRNVQQLLNEAEASDTPDMAGMSTTEAALGQAQEHRKNALEQLDRSKQIAETATVTVAILESIDDYDSATDETQETEDNDAAVVEGVES